MPYHLMRTWYVTDADMEDTNNGVGTWSGTIPDSAFENGKVVDVDWSVRGEVQVTFLCEGRGYDE